MTVGILKHIKPEEVMLLVTRMDTHRILQKSELYLHDTLHPSSHFPRHPFNVGDIAGFDLIRHSQLIDYYRTDNVDVTAVIHYDTNPDNSFAIAKWILLSNTDYSTPWSQEALQWLVKLDSLKICLRN